MAKVCRKFPDMQARIFSRGCSTTSPPPPVARWWSTPPPPDPWAGYQRCLTDPPDCTHLLVIQDDAIPVPGFAEVLPQIAQPTRRPVCLWMSASPANAAGRARRAYGQTAVRPAGTGPVRSAGGGAVARDSPAAFWSGRRPPPGSHAPTTATSPGGCGRPGAKPVHGAVPVDRRARRLHAFGEGRTSARSHGKDRSQGGDAARG